MAQAPGHLREPHLQSDAPIADPPRPTRVRYQVLAYLCGLSMITYLDRVCFGAAAPTLANELQLTGVAELKWAFTAFSIAYSLFEIPAGWYGDRFGPRRALIRIVSWWSLCTILTGLVGLRVGSFAFGGLGTLIVIRFLFGAGEAGAYPNITRAIQNWFPRDQWEKAQGLIWMSGRLAGGLTPLIWAVLVNGTEFFAPVTNWRGAFLFFGFVGFIWCGLFAVWFRNQPYEHALVNEAEREAIGSTDSAGTAEHGAIPWRAMLTNRSLLALCLTYSLVNYGWIFNITYLPEYLEQRFDVAGSSLLFAIYKGAPLWVGAIGCLCGGPLVDFFSRLLGSRSKGRRASGMLAMLICMGCWLGARIAPNIHLFCLSISLAAFCIDATLGAIWATCQDIGKAHTGVTAACMNSIGTLGAALASWGTGTIVQMAIARHSTVSPDISDTLKHAATLEGYQLVFLTYAGVYALAAFTWLAIDAERPIQKI